MSTIGKSERETQSRIKALFRDDLGYKYLGDWSDRHTNSNIEENLLGDYLMRAGYTKDQISRAIYRLKTEAENPNRSLYDNNKAVYSLLRYGVPVKIEARPAIHPFVSVVHHIIAFVVLTPARHWTIQNAGGEQPWFV
jgi:type I restriction enzyme R subunit